MKKKNVFEDTENMILDKMSQEFPVLTDEEKDRIFAMSERKYNISKKNEDVYNKFEDFDIDTNNEVKGVEQYSQPIWYKIISISAAAVLTFSGAAGSMMLMKHGSRNLPATEVEETTSAEYTAPTEPPTEDISEYMSAALDLTDKVAYYEKIFYNHDIDIDENDTLTFTMQNYEGTEHEKNYARVTAPDIQSDDDLKNALLPLFTDGFKDALYSNSCESDDNNITFDMGICAYLYPYYDFIIDLSGYENGAVINNFPDTYDFITYNENLYVCTDNMDRDTDFYSCEPEIISHSDEHFEATRMAIGPSFNSFPNAEVGTKVIFSFKKENGEWKIDSIVPGRCVELCAAAAVQNYFNYICTDYSPDELDIHDETDENGTVIKTYIEKFDKNIRVMKHNSDKNCNVYCIIKNKEGKDYLEFTADVEFLSKQGYDFISDEDNSKYFSYSNVVVKEIR